MKNERFKLGLIFNFNPKWMGGIIYLLNAIKILKFLDDKDMPKVLVFYNPGLKKFIDEIDYPYVEKIPWNFHSVYYGFALSILRQRNLFIHDMVTKYNLDAIYPMHDFPVKSKLDAKLVRQKVLDREVDLSKNPFVTHVLIDNWKECGDSFQKYLVSNKLSSHMWVVARKK